MGASTPKAPKIDAAAEKAKEDAAAAEAARKLRAQERLRSGSTAAVLASSNPSDFASLQTGKKTLLGGGR